MNYVVRFNLIASLARPSFLHLAIVFSSNMMYSTGVGLLLLSAVAAQSTVEIFNMQPDMTITFKSADAKATTYEKGCDQALSTSSPSSQGKTSNPNAFHLVNAVSVAHKF